MAHNILLGSGLNKHSSDYVYHRTRSHVHLTCFRCTAQREYVPPFNETSALRLISDDKYRRHNAIDPIHIFPFQQGIQIFSSRNLALHPQPSLKNCHEGKNPID